MRQINSIIIRQRLIARHRELSRGTPEEMEIAKRILHFLNHHEIRLSLDDADFFTELELEDAGVIMRYSRSYNTAYASLPMPQEV